MFDAVPYMIGTGMGVLVSSFMRGWRRWDHPCVEARMERLLFPEACYLRAAYECGMAAGSDLYGRDGDAPVLTPLTSSWEPDDSPQLDYAQCSAAMIAFARGRHDGWWEDASIDLIDQAHQFINEGDN